MLVSGTGIGAGVYEGIAVGVVLKIPLEDGRLWFANVSNGRFAVTVSAGAITGAVCEVICLRILLAATLGSENGETTCVTRISVVSVCLETVIPKCR